MYVQTYNDMHTRISALIKDDKIKLNNFLFISDPKNIVLGKFQNFCNTI